MNTNNNQFNIILLIMSVSLTTAAIVWIILSDANMLYLIPLGALWIGLLFRLIYIFNESNRKLSYFFEAIRNEDTSLIFPEQRGNKSVRRLNASINGLNRKISEILLRNERNEMFYRELIEQSTTGLMSFDDAGYVTVMNSAAKKYLGVIQLANMQLLAQKNPLLHQTVTQLKPGEKCIVKSVVDNELLTLSVQTTEMHFGNQRHVIVSIQDIRYELEEAEIDSWQKLIRVMTHEIMNSIAPITSLSHTLLGFLNIKDKPVEPNQLTTAIISDTVEGLNVIEERGKGLIHFVENYRKLAKIPQPTFKTVDVKVWIQGLYLLFKPTFEQFYISFSYSSEDRIRTILTDEKMLNQIMINLMNNAIEAVCSNPDTEPREISLSVRMSNINESIHIELSDNGSGIEDDIIDKIFVPFCTTKEDGNGIGLSLSRQLASKLNMKLGICSRQKKGTTFRLEL